ncbi:type II secretion system F family protein [Bacillus sp. FJAT-27245]|uniref:type II secretion system F family protein n=1 Tax=Bacillus sp. FJAT-27245 TaxID=1684144 RepID=UPI0006A7B4B7|nr:type II secretion system F family protein [Bacillus sp. FJAT-27245]
MRENIIVLLVGSIVLFTIIFQLFISSVGQKLRMKKRLTSYSLINNENDEEKEGEKKKGAMKVSHPSLFKRVGEKSSLFFPSISKWEIKLAQGRSSFTPGEFFLFRILCVVAFSLAAYALNFHFLLIVPIGIVSFWFPVFHLNKKIEKRLNRGSFQLAEALGTMANSMRAGFSFIQAMKLISEEFPDPIGTEFEKTLQDMNFGVPVEEAFKKMLERLPDKELEMAVMSMLIQRASGGNLAFLLETIRETVAGRIQIKEELRTLTAQGKLSTWIITGLPIGLAFYLKLVNPEYFNLLLEHPLGIVLLSMGGIGIVMGWFFIRKIVRIEV